MISRRFLLILVLAGLSGTASIGGSLPAPRLNVLTQGFLEGPPAPPRPEMPIFAAAEGKAGRLVGLRLQRIGVTVYSPADVTLVHPGDSLLPERDVCSGI